MLRITSCVHPNGTNKRVWARTVRTAVDRAAGMRREVTEKAAIPAAMTRLPPILSASVPPSSCVPM